MVVILLGAVRLDVVHRAGLVLRELLVLLVVGWVGWLVVVAGVLVVLVVVLVLVRTVPRFVVSVACGGRFVVSAAGGRFVVSAGGGRRFVPVVLDEG